MTSYALPCARCGGPVPLAEPEPPGTLAFHQACYDAAFERGGRVAAALKAAEASEARRKAALAWEARAEADRRRHRPGRKGG